MPRNLESKVKNLLADIDTLSDLESRKMVKKFIKEEMKFLEKEHEIGPFDLNVVTSQAIQTFVDTDLSAYGSWAEENPDEFRAWCYIDAVIMMLREKGLIPFTIKYNRKK